VYPTPTIGMVGTVEDLQKKMTLDFKKEGDLIYILGPVTDDIACSEYLHKIKKINYSPAPHFDLETEYAIQQKTAEIISAGLIKSAHDISEGGLLVTLCESGFNRTLGFDIKTSANTRKDAFLFGEGQSRIVVTVDPFLKEQFENVLSGFELVQIGTVTNGDLMVDGKSWGAINEWKMLYDTAIENLLTGALQSEAALGML
jgi:phosphoribosylformylglycinamidine synthase subunit PurL